MTSLPGELIDLAASRHGVLRRGELVDGGITRRKVDRLVRLRVIERVGRGTYKVGGAPVTDAQRLLIACFDSSGVATHRSACALHGLGNHSLRDRSEVIIYEARNCRSKLARLRTTSTLDEEDVTVVDGIPCTTVARTLLSMASIAGLMKDGKEISEWAVEDLFDEALAKGKTTIDEVKVMLERCRRSGRGGVKLIERLVEEREAGAITESHLERVALAALLEAWSDPPECQARIAPEGEFVARVDFFYPEANLIIEVSGYRWHRTVEQMQRDARRRRDLVRLGVDVLEFTFGEVVRQRAMFKGTVRSALLAALAKEKAGSPEVPEVA